MAIFWKPEACGQTVLPERSILIGHKLMENAQIKKFKYDIFGDFQTLWILRDFVPKISIFDHLEHLDEIP